MKTYCVNDVYGNTIASCFVEEDLPDELKFLEAFQYVLDNNIDTSRIYFPGYTFVEQNFSNLNLRYADLSYCQFDNFDFSNSDLSEADLDSTVFLNCNMTDVKWPGDFNPTSGIPEGEFEVWKVVLVYVDTPDGKECVNMLLKMVVPADAKFTRLRSHRDRLRVSKALPVEFHWPYYHPKAGTPVSAKLTVGTPPVKNYARMYRLGEMYEADGLDLNPCTVCSYGIHCFLNRQSAEEYSASLD